MTHGIDLPPIPDCLKDLTLAEERLASPRIPFMQIRRLGYEKQCGIKGAVVNVPISLDSTTRILPRNLNNTHTIQIHIRRKMCFKHDYMCETIRPAKILEAARYLVTTPVYKKENIKLSESWQRDNYLDVNSEEHQPFILSDDDLEALKSILNDDFDSAQVNNELEDLFPDDEVNPGAEETLLDNTFENIVIAPGEGKIPVSLLFDLNAEILAFPTIFGGQERKFPAFLTYTKLIRSLILNRNRAACRADFLLFGYRKSELYRLSNTISTCLRQKQNSSMPIPKASDFLNEEFIDNLIQHNQGYRFLKNFPSSPSYWEKEQIRMLAAIRQLGMPTFFITLSAAETRWPELLMNLSKLIDDKDISMDENIQLSFNERARLIQLDPVTCARYFDRRIRALLKLFKGKYGIFDENPVVNWHYRIEFQHRGSPHLHGLFWLKNAPEYKTEDSNSKYEICNFIDSFISTNSKSEGCEQFIELQRHSHTKSCKRELKNGEGYCRFNIPYPPLNCTKILMPLDVKDIPKQDLEKYHENYEKVKIFLNDKENIVDIKFEEYLKTIDLSDEIYIHALRSQIKIPKIFLERNLIDVYINAFNSDILKLHRANMDIQFVLDPYACCKYITNYLFKSNRGLSAIMREGLKETLQNHMSVRKQLRTLGNKFVNASEISAQEAAYTLLGQHMSECSNAHVFINTYPPDKRVHILKSKKEIQKLAQETPDSNDIFVSDIFDHYAQRPDDLKNLCLADFVAWFNFSKRKPSGRNIDDKCSDSENSPDDQEEEVEEKTEVNNPIYALEDKSGYIRKRTKEKIIRFKTYDVKSDPDNYYRTKLTLYFPFRNEKKEIACPNVKEIYSKNIDVIIENEKKYNKMSTDMSEIIAEMVNETTNVDENESDEIAGPEERDKKFQIYGIRDTEDHDIVLDFPTLHDRTLDDITVIKIPLRMEHDRFENLITSLNHKQREYLQHFLHKIKSSEPFYEIITGGAGVGKSTLIKTIYESGHIDIMKKN